ncbi:hypothetical protein K439DRAFT_1627085 [Ramaria rubella]|nr:hypothetical protein K439DRAFT_1627085 [Ramaria rubella]
MELCSDVTYYALIVMWLTPALLGLEIRDTALNLQTHSQVSDSRGILAALYSVETD